MYCWCNIRDYDHPAVIRDEFPTARKSYLCCECGETISPGQKYHKAVGLWENGWRTFRTCMPCYRLRDELCPEGYVFGELSDVTNECLGFDYRRVPND